MLSQVAPMARAWWEQAEEGDEAVCPCASSWGHAVGKLLVLNSKKKRKAMVWDEKVISEAHFWAVQIPPLWGRASEGKNPLNKKWVSCSRRGYNNDDLVDKLSVSELWELRLYFNRGVESLNWHCPWNWLFSIRVGDGWKMTLVWNSLN